MDETASSSCSNPFDAFASTDVSSSPADASQQTPSSFLHRTDSAQQPRRRHRPPYMESVSENSANTVDTAIHHDVSLVAIGTKDDQMRGLNRLSYNRDTASTSGSSHSTNLSTRRRRNRDDGCRSVGRGGSLDRNFSRRQGRHDGSFSRIRNRQRGQQSVSSTILGSERDENQHIDRRRIALSPLSASLDAGMASLTRWIRSHQRQRSISSERGAGSIVVQQIQSTSSTPRISLGQDIGTLSAYAGDDIVRGASSLLSGSNIPYSNNSGHVYFRRHEVVVNPNSEVDTIYDCDDESGTHPLVQQPGNAGQQTIVTRRRAFSEPDRARLIVFFSSVYESRAIDGRRRSTRSRHLSSNRSNFVEQPTEQVANVTAERRVSFAEAPSSITTEEGERSVQPVTEQSTEFPPSSTDNEAGVHQSQSIGHEQPASSFVETMENPNPTTDPNRRARRRWIQINRRFQLAVKIASLLFSLMLFGISVCWVFFIICYVISLEQVCDVPLKAYFWLSTLQLVVDVFRAEIMKWLCQYRVDSRMRVPLRVVFFNFVYLVYSIMILRLGVRCVFLSGSPKCAQTSPELFFVSAAFVCLNLAAWATIFFGYLVPFCMVAILLTCNGYFPNGGIRGGRGRVGIGISGIVEFPNAYSNPAPVGCIEQMRVMLLNEFRDSYSKECCICMMEYITGEVIVQTPCDHLFHKRCCREWLQLARTCPICRTDIPEALGMTEGSTVDSTAPGNSTESRRPLRVEVSNLVNFLRHRGNSDTNTNNSAHPPVIEIPSGVAHTESTN